MSTAKTADIATYDIADDGCFVFCTPLLVPMVPSKPAKGQLIAVAAVPAYNKWDCGVTAITAALSHHGFHVVTNPQIQTRTEKDKTVEKFSVWPRTDGQDPATTSNSVLHELLNVAHAMGVASTNSGSINITPVQHALLRLQHRDVDGQVASGSLQALLPDPLSRLNRVPFVVYAPSVKAKTIVIVITVGGVKVTITVRW